MARCDFCGSIILFGGFKEENRRFCGPECHAEGALVNLSQQFPDHSLQQEVWKLHQGPCPKCGGSGPVDVHTSYRVWSAVLLTKWSSLSHVSCRKCAIKAQLGDAAFCAILGWWGLPWGLALTPVQIVRNIWGAISPPDAAQPSTKLDNYVRLNLSTQIAPEHRKQAAQTQPIHP